jgi:nicotinate phosphoribosyltransferase
MITPIIKSILDNDLYTFTVGQVAFKEFPNARVTYEFINRGKTQFPDGFADELFRQVKFMSELRLAQGEYEYMDGMDLFGYDYLQFLRRFRFDPSELDIHQDGGDLSVLFNGKWVSAIMWEVPFLGLVSELYYKMTGKTLDPDWHKRLVAKTANLSINGCKWMEFGTRRRFSAEVQDAVVKEQMGWAGFLGTSNVFLAYKYGVPCLGTMSHQGPMAMQALYSATLCNKEWREVWKKVYPNKLMVFLPDTVTTDVFLRDFTKEEALEWNLRQDSGDPDVWLKKIINFYIDNGIDSHTKTAVLSDSLNDTKGVDFTKRYSSYINIVLGIGTFLTNDCGHKPLNIVVKLIEADFGDGMRPVVKLSDTNGKYTGEPMAISATKAELYLPLTDDERFRMMAEAPNDDLWGTFAADKWDHENARNILLHYIRQKRLKTDCLEWLNKNFPSDRD